MSTTSRDYSSPAPQSVGSNDYQRGYQQALLDAQAQIDRAESAADYWYSRFLNPELHEKLHSEIESHLDVLAARDKQRERVRQMDEAEALVRERAREMISHGADDAEVAITLSMFIGVVRNIREGKL